jgi:peroxiredoxin
MKAVSSLVLALVPVVALAGTPQKASPIGKTIANFQLRDYRGPEHSLSEFTDAKLAVVVFMGTECPVAKLYGPRLSELANEYASKGVKFVGISSNQQDSITVLTDYAREHKIPFPILKDVGNGVADQFGAIRTPEAFVLDPQRVIRYWGRIDDQYGVGYSRPKAEHRDLAAALDELLAGKPVSTPVTDASGCFIGRVQKPAKNGAITYSKHIAPILQKNCVGCHHEGEIAPFALTTYQEVIGWTDTIEEVLRQGRMPPWHANPAYGHFANDARLPDADKELVYQWIKDGAPEGDPKDLPKPVELVKGWRIPKPDVVISIPKAFDVPATGEVQYQYIVVDPGFKEDKWVRAAEARPECRAVVHHILVFVLPPEGMKDRRGFGENWLAAAAPGTRPMILPEGRAKFIPAGSRLLFQIHYTPNGVAVKDQSSVALTFADPKTVKQEVIVDGVANPDLVIPARDANVRVEATKTIYQDSLLLDLMPHTHLRGKTFRYEAIYPDGKKEILLDLPKYDFNWQNTYVLAEPKLLPKGTQLHCVAYYDNSTHNKSNPNPDAEVRWGDQTWEEMMIGYYDMVPAHQELHPKEHKAAVAKKEVAVDPELRELAIHARDSKEAFAAFAAAVHKTLPQVDRVCMTSFSDGKLKVEQASYPGTVAKHVFKAGFEGQSKAFALGHFALLGEFQTIGDISKSWAADLSYLGQTLGSSVHVPFTHDGIPGTVNFWSKQKNAFPKTTHDLLRTLGELAGQGAGAKAS